MPTNDQIKATIAVLEHPLDPFSVRHAQRAAAMLRAILAEREWRDMDSAPKDGTAILCCKTGYDPFICEWRDEKGGKWFSQYIPGFWHEGPELWLPLPTPETGE